MVEARKAEARKVEAVGPEELLQRARALLPRLKERAFRTAQANQVLEESVQDILDAQLNRVAVPLRFGGFDVEFEIHHQIAMELARGCGATAWCFSLWGVHTYWLAYFTEQAQQELFANGPNLLTSSASFSVKSSYQRVPGGFRVSGHWRFVSGCDHARWVFAVVRGPEGMLDAIIPRADFKILQDTWKVSGLEGTGSKDIVVEDVFVPEHRTLLGAAAEIYAVDHPTQRIRGGHEQRRYKVPKFSLLIWDLVAPGIGLAQAAVDEIVARMKGTGGRLRSGESPVVQNKISESSAEIDAARALLHTDFEDVQGKGERGDPISVLDLARYARDRAYAVKLAVNATNRMFDMAGGQALFLTDPLQRIHRDVQAVMHRDGLVFDFASQAYARTLMGMDPGEAILRK